MEPITPSTPKVLGRRYVYVHTTDEGYACLEDGHGSSLYVPLDWLPENASLGAPLRIKAKRCADTATVEMNIDLVAVFRHVVILEQEDE